MKTFYSMGIMNYCSHDPACALIKIENGNFDYIFAEEGFLSRRKKSYQFPIRSIKYCLDYFNIDLERVDVLMLDFMDAKRTYRTSHNYRLLVGDFIRSRLNISPDKIHFVRSHHYAHALTAFWPSAFTDAAVLVVDGLGSEQQTHSIFHMDSYGRQDLIFEQKGVGIGTLYSLITAALGFESGEEGKTMGLAPYGRNFSDIDLKLPSLSGSYDGFVTDYSKQIYRNPTPTLRFNVNPIVAKEDVYEPYYSRLAYNLQEETERCLTHLAKQALTATFTKNICLAGGVALNCVANNKIQSIEGLEGLFVQPAAGDTGIPIGLALAGLEIGGFKLSELLTREVRDKLAVPYSADYSPLSKLCDARLNEVLDKNKVVKSAFDSNDIATKISEKNVVALFSGGIELGPRALGHRSFLADARNSEMKDILNSKIKHREPYRPFAPIVLEEDFHLYFSSACDKHPYMLQAPTCKEHALTVVPAICHVDGTARVQTVGYNLGKVREILESYKNLTGVSVLINTSFNDNNEPIVFTKIDALISFLNCNADILVLEGDVIVRSAIPNILSLRAELLEINEKLRNQYFKSALGTLTTINEDTSSDELFNFLKFNAELSNVYRKERIVIKLIDFLSMRDKSRILYLDDAHLNQIRKLAKMMGTSAEALMGVVCIVEDNYYAAKTMRDDSDFILYNFSAFYFNEHLRLENDSFASLTSFYNLEDKRLNLNFDFVSQLSTDGDRYCIEEICSTYENNLSMSIENLFLKIGIVRS